MPLRFEWDPQKAAQNHRKHGVRFEEASTVFHDPLAAIFDDTDTSLDERREIIVGYSAAGIADLRADGVASHSIVLSCARLLSPHATCGVGKISA